MTDDQDRGQWTSASGAQRDSLCPASHLRQRGLPEDPSADSEYGIAVHDWLSGKDAELTDDQMDAAIAAIAIEQQLIGNLLGIELSTDELRLRRFPKLEIYREKRFWLHWTALTGMKISHSGQVDLLVINGNKAFLSERKSLWGQVAESPANLQVRDQVVLVMSNLPGIKEVHAIVNQPRVKRKPVATLYTIDDFNRAMAEMSARAEASNNPNARAVPGEIQCRFCRAKSVCPEFLASNISFNKLVLDNPWEIENAVESIATLPSARLGAGLGMARLLAEAFEAEVRKRLAAEQLVDGWKLSPGRVTEKIVDPQVVFERFMAMGGAQADFMQAVGVGKGKLENVVRKATGTQGGALKEAMDKLLAGATESKRTAEILEKT